jgi:phosphatidylglycerol:prolipoprotein diacylglycerol transferase
MINFLHNFYPEPIIFSIGPISIFYYGVLIVIGILLGSLILFHLGKSYQLNKDLIIDSAFYIVLSAIIGGRLYHILLEANYYLEHPLNAFMLWKGGLAIHGAIIGGVISIFYFAKKNKIDPWLLTALYTPALALGQSIGRFGNYFNQELFGLPTDLPWGIPINPMNRVAPYLEDLYFHPTFIYESIGNLIIFTILFFLHKLAIKKSLNANIFIIATYLLLYSLLRFSLEFIRIDTTPVLFGIRWPQYFSIFLIIISFYLFYKERALFSDLLKKHSTIAKSDNSC